MGTEKVLDREHYLSIKLDGELFAISVNQVLEVLEKQSVTRIPNMPDFIKGVINFRGDILPVIETRQKFNMNNREEGQSYVIIVVELQSDSRNLKLGIMADGVKDVFDIDRSDIKEVPEIGANYNVEFLKGMIRQDEGFIMLLDVDRIFSSDEVTMISMTHDVE